MVAVGLLIRLRMGRPILFRQMRPGFRGRPFMLLKFRTMRNAHTPDGQPLPDALRLTRLGRFLRRTSLDELPQLLNILTGDMSLVGPRPALFNQDDLISLRTEKGVHRLIPGITGWAQINGRDELPIPKKVELDVYYLANRSFRMDLQILLGTFINVLKRDGVSH